MTSSSGEQLEAILQEHKLSQTALIDPDTAVTIGKLAAAEGVLLGTVLETPNALDVFARFVDVETSVILAAEDVYGEDLASGRQDARWRGSAGNSGGIFRSWRGLVIEWTGITSLSTWRKAA